MRTAIISDIHANIEALDAMLRAVEKQRVDRVVCLGDIVGYGPDPNACIERVRSVCATVVLGNHDEWVSRPPDYASVAESVWQSIQWTARVVREEHRIYLASLPLIVHDDAGVLVHSAPTHPSAWEYIIDFSSAARYFSVLEKGTCFVGHSHIPGVYRQESGATIVNVGSVGQPRDGNPAACALILDDGRIDDQRFTFLRAEYDTEATARKIVDQALPDYFAYRLGKGR